MTESRVYPIFTDGEKFIHSSEPNLPDKCRHAYWSRQDLKEWKKKEAKTLTPEMAKQIYDRWEK